VSRTSGAEVISLLDGKSGYNQVKVHEPDQAKTHFVFEGVHYVFVRGPFGYKHFTSAFQHIMEQLFHGSWVLIYVDDVIVISRSVADHISHLSQILSTANKYNLRFNWDKVQIGFRKLAILGHIVSGSTMEIDPSKMDLLLSIPRPSTGPQVESLLGLASYLRQYIPLYSTLLAPFEQVRKARTVQWNEKLEGSWQGLRAVISSAPLLHHATEGVELEVATDASNVGVGAVLYQTIAGQRRYIMFAAKALNSAQQNYPASKKELLALVFSLRAFDQWLSGRRFTVYTDHQALTFLLTTKSTTQTLRYWHDILLQYDFRIVHRPGALNCLPDAISRLYPSTTKAFHAVLGGGKTTPEVTITLFAATQLGMKVPSPEERTDLLEKAHRQLGHRSKDGLFKQLYSEGYYWPSMRNDCQLVVEKCDSCMQEDVKQRGFHPLSLLERTFPFELVSVDLFGPMQTSADGYNYALVMVDAATRYCITRATQSKTAEDTAAALLLIFWEHGFPNTLRSDRGREFINQVLDEIARRAEISIETTPPYSPQSNGSAESHVKLVRQALKRIMLDCEAEPPEWPKFLSAATWAVNNRVANRHMSRPIELYLGRPARALHPLGFNSPASSSADPPSPDQLEKHVKWLQEVIWPASRAATTAHNKRRKAATDKTRPQLLLHPGDVVMVEAPPRSPKHAPSYTGPYTVLEPHDRVPSAYRLRLQDGTLLPSPISITRLKLISRADNQIEYVVDRVLKERHLPGRPKEFLVSWVGYDEQTWEPESSFVSSDGTRTNQLLEYLNSKTPKSSVPRSLSRGAVPRTMIRG
jgi:transposase InsO family protein